MLSVTSFGVQKISVYKKTEQNISFSIYTRSQLERPHFFGRLKMYIEL